MISDKRALNSPSLDSNKASMTSPLLAELEMLTSKLVGLEGQLCTLVRGLEASAAIGDITTEVGHLLQERTQHLDSLHQSSHWLQEELSSLAMVCMCECFSICVCVCMCILQVEKILHQQSISKSLHGLFFSRRTRL